jgi:membrane protein DedA with SNARE-associated domain
VLTTIAAALSSAPQPALPGFLEALASPLEHYGLWAIFFLVLVEDFGIPVPGETVIIAASIYAGSGRLNVVAVGVVAFVAAVFGDNIGYGIGRFGGRRLVDRWGKYVFLTPERLDKAEDFFDRQGAKIITIARFIEGLRQANGIIAGITKMHWLRFIAYNALGAALWVGTWVSIGYFAGQHIDTIYSIITRYSLYVAIAAVVVILALIARHVLRKRRQAVRPNRSAGSAAATAGAAAGAPAGSGGGGGSGDGSVGGEAAGDGEDEAAAEDAGEAGSSGEAGGTGGNERSEPSAAAEAARTYAAPVDADHAGDADDGAEPGSSDNA